MRSDHALSVWDDLGRFGRGSQRSVGRHDLYDVVDPADRITSTYNRQSQPTTKTDQNGTVHGYSYDLLGRQTAVAMTTLGAGVDGTVRRIATAYEVRGMASLVTSYNAASGGSVLNQVQKVYNTFA